MDRIGVGFWGGWLGWVGLVAAAMVCIEPSVGKFMTIVIGMVALLPSAIGWAFLWRPLLEKKAEVV